MVLFGVDWSDFTRLPSWHGAFGDFDWSHGDVFSKVVKSGGLKRFPGFAFLVIFGHFGPY